MENPNDEKTDKKPVILTLILIVAVLFWVGILIANIYLAIGAFGYIILWAVGIFVMLLMLALAGQEINNQWFGVLIDSRNKVSLSRLQILLWTVMVLSAYFSMAIPRVLATLGEKPTLSQKQALDIAFPPELILAMGISATSFAGSNLIKNTKKSKKFKIEAKLTPDAALERLNDAKSEFDKSEKELLDLASEEDTLKKVSDNADQEFQTMPSDPEKIKAKNKAKTDLESKSAEKLKKINEREAKKQKIDEAEKELKDITDAQGLLHKNASPAEAGWVDLFRGEEIGNYMVVDMSKVQMLFFTIVVIFTYSAQITSTLTNGQVLLLPAASFPDFSPSLNALLGISHGTYLSVKTVDSN